MNNKLINKDCLLEIYKKHEGRNWNLITKEYNAMTGEQRNPGTLRSAASRNPEMFEGYKVDYNFNELTDQIIDQKMEPLTESKILELCNLDEDEFKLKETNTGIINRWWLDSQGSENEMAKRIRNGQIKIHFEKRPFKINHEYIEELINNINIKPINIKRNISNGNGLIEIPLFDMHFGNNSYEDYIKHQEQIYKYLDSQEWDQALFVVGQDLLHNDNFRGTTSNGTIIEKEDMDQAYEDAFKFYAPLIEKALEQSLNVNIIYSRGNHDETLAWTFVKMLDKLYPQIEVDSKQLEHKSFIYKNIFLGYTHGHRINDKKVVRNFEALFRLEMAQSKRRIIKKGHIHTLKSFDDNGTQVMTLGTANKTDEWHLENGFIGNHKSFEIFIYNDDSLKAHIYID